MRVLLLTVAVCLFCLSSQARSQDVPKTLDECSGFLGAIQRNMATLPREQIRALFRSVDEFCMRSVEFSEWVNEVLYTVLGKHPRRFVEVFEEIPRRNQDKILSELSRPVHDGIDVQGTYAMLQVVNRERKVNGRIIEALHRAAASFGTSTP